MTPLASPSHAPASACALPPLPPKHPQHPHGHAGGLTSPTSGSSPGLPTGTLNDSLGPNAECRQAPEVMLKKGLVSVCRPPCPFTALALLCSEQ
jgi:hypothetical protein